MGDELVLLVEGALAQLAVDDNLAARGAAFVQLADGAAVCACDAVGREGNERRCVVVARF